MMSNFFKFAFAFVLGLVIPFVFLNAISSLTPFPIMCIIGLAVPMMNPIANTIAYIHVILMTTYVYTSTNTYVIWNASTVQIACASTSISFMSTALMFIFAQVFVLANRNPNIALVNMFNTRALAFALASIAMFGCTIAITIMQP